MGIVRLCFFFFKQKTAYEMRISNWSSDVCSSDLAGSDWTRTFCRAAPQRFAPTYTMAARRPRHMEKLVVTPQLNSRPARPEAAHTLESAGIHPLLARPWAGRGITDANPATLNCLARTPTVTPTPLGRASRWRRR